MLTNSKNPRFPNARRVMILPLMAIVAVLFAFRTANHQDVQQAGGVLQLRAYSINDTTIKNGAINDSNFLILKTKALKDSDLQVIKLKLMNDDSARKHAITMLGNSYSANNKEIKVVRFNDSTKPHPLFIVNGKIWFDEISKINPQNIVSINVLKDKAALDKYGNLGQNGVVELTLKKAKPLYILDGKQMPADFDIATITSSDIERVNVWKEDLAIAKYGEAGKNGVVEITSKVPTIKLLNDKIFTEPEIPASFPGGKAGWQKYLERNLNRDLPVKNGAPAGKYAVNMNFIVDENGSVSHVIAENDPGYGTKDEALRVIKKGPAWVPAVQNGKKVTSLVKQSITFVISVE